MAFTVKNWVDGRAGGTPVNALGLKDLEQRVTAYTDTQAGGGLEVVDVGTVSTNVTTDMLNSQEKLLIATLGANGVKFPVTNWSAGKSLTIICKQDATGGRTLGTDPWPATHWEGGAEPVGTLTANGIDIRGFFSDGTNVYGFESGTGFAT